MPYLFEEIKFVNSNQFPHFLCVLDGVVEEPQRTQIYSAVIFTFPSVPLRTRPLACPQTSLLTGTRTGTGMLSYRLFSNEHKFPLTNADRTFLSQ